MAPLVLSVILLGGVFAPQLPHWVVMWAQVKPAASGSSKVTDVAVSGHRKMLELLKEIGEQAKEDNPAWGEANARRLRAELAALPEEGKEQSVFSNVARWQLYYELGEAELQLGNELEAIDKLSQAYQRLPKVKEA